jgi:hypothetical protein
LAGVRERLQMQFLMAVAVSGIGLGSAGHVTREASAVAGFYARAIRTSAEETSASGRSVRPQTLRPEDAVGIMVVAVNYVLDRYLRGKYVAPVIAIDHVRPRVPGMTLPPSFDIGTKLAGALDLPARRSSDVGVCSTDHSDRTRCRLVGADVLVDANITSIAGEKANVAVSWSIGGPTGTTAALELVRHSGAWSVSRVVVIVEAG